MSNLGQGLSNELKVLLWSPYPLYLLGGCPIGQTGTVTSKVTLDLYFGSVNFESRGF
jgi:hypothetical protein